ncbi:MAG: hypothetical protein E3J72_21405 [Planctomycetota bacterium]|nr:MAG: hypothetical protein E3J72_21405 [Planctomycetota bacterium]
METRKRKKAARRGGKRKSKDSENRLIELRNRRHELMDELSEVDVEIRRLEQEPGNDVGEPLSFDDILPGFDNEVTAAAFEYCRQLLFTHEERANGKVEKKKHDDFGYKLTSRWFMLLKFSRYYFDVWVNPKFRLHERLPEDLRIELNLRKSKNRGWEGLRLSSLDQVRRLAPYLEKHVDN